MHEQTEVFTGGVMEHPEWCSPARCTAPARYAVDEWAYEEFVESDAYRGGRYEHASAGSSAEPRPFRAGSAS
ncbi:hypothetical protein GCM10010277_70620 [Streptomyces longisporoflavus]|nr:hypothetical protein GCM10010277_70620 [Streptomyces longisporoflavus]